MTDGQLCEICGKPTRPLARATAPANKWRCDEHGLNGPVMRSRPDPSGDFRSPTVRLAGISNRLARGGRQRRREQGKVNDERKT